MTSGARKTADSAGSMLAMMQRMDVAVDRSGDADTPLALA